MIAAAPAGTSDGRALRDAVAKQRQFGRKINGDHRMRLTPPTKMTLLVSVVLASLAIVGQFVNMVSNYIPISMFWVAIVAYFVLLLGNLVRGF